MDEQSRKYDNVFPSVSVSYPIGNTQLMISYSGNIERPSYYKLSSAVTYGNKYTYESGESAPALFDTEHFVAQRIMEVAIFQYELQSHKGYADTDKQIIFGYRPFRFTVHACQCPKVDKLNATLSASPKIGIWSPQFTSMYSQQWFVMDTPDGRRTLIILLCTSRGITLSACLKVFSWV